MTLLARLRFDRGLTQAEVAAATGLSRATIMRVEAGGDLIASTAKALADFYGTTASDLVAAVRADEAERQAA